MFYLSPSQPLVPARVALARLARLVFGQVLIAQQLTPEQQMIFETSTLKHRRALFAKGILRPAMAVAGESEDCSICYEAMELSLGR